MSKPANGRLVVMCLMLVLLIAYACSQTSEENNREVTRPADPTGDGEIGSCGLGLTQPVTDEEAIVALLEAEGDYVVRQDIAALMRLWQPGGCIVDAKHTPANLEDDQTWQGVEAIRHRYVHRVFPGAPAVAGPADLIISIDGEEAVATGTTQIGDEVSPGGDRWRLVKQDGCWMIQELVFNLEPS